MRPRQRKSESGNALIEFALGLPLLWLLFAGVYEFGYAFYVYNVLQASTANAAELGSTLAYDSASPGTYTSKLKNMVVYGDENSAGVNALVQGLSTDNVSVVLDDPTFPRYLTITITGYKIDGLFQQFTLNSKPRVTTGYYGTISCSTC